MPRTVLPSSTFSHLISMVGLEVGRHYGPASSRGNRGSERGRDLRSQNPYVVKLACIQNPALSNSTP